MRACAGGAGCPSVARSRTRLTVERMQQLALAPVAAAAGLAVIDDARGAWEAAPGPPLSWKSLRNPPVRPPERADAVDPAPRDRRTHAGPPWHPSSRPAFRGLFALMARLPVVTYAAVAGGAG